MADPSDVPPPLQWHPWYRDKPYLLDWLEGRGRYRGKDRICIQVPPPPRPVTAKLDLEEPVTMCDAPQMRIMRRRRASGPAPYVGEPFHYEWTVGVDDLGRCIAGEARIVYSRRYPTGVP